MKKTTSALVIAAALALPIAGQAASADFGGDYTWSGFSTDGNALDSNQSPTLMTPLAYSPYEGLTTTKTTTQNNTHNYSRGYNQLLRLKGTLKNDDGVSLNFRLKLSDTNWAGDTHATNGMAGPYTNQASDLVSLDYGFVQFPLAGWTVRVGRQEANWAFNFLTSDDRRDRILALRKFGGTTVLGVMDKRQEGSFTNEKDDGDLYALGAVGVNSGWLWGALGGYWNSTKPKDGGTYALSQAKLLTVFAKGKAGPVEITGSAHVIFGAAEGALYENTGESEFLRLGWSTGPVKLEGQIAAIQHGGLVAGGFDTFSSMINNSPDNYLSSTSVQHFGSLGITNLTDELTQYLPAVRVTGKIGDKVTLMGAAGDFISKNDSKASKTEFSRMFVDLQAHYQVTPSLKSWATVGYLGGDSSAKDAAGAKMKLSDQMAWSVNLSANF